MKLFHEISFFSLLVDTVLLFTILLLVISIFLIPSKCLATEGAKHMSNSPLLRFGSTMQNELVIRLCEKLSYEQLMSLTALHNVTVLKQSSPSLVVVTWYDQRKLEIVKKSLDSDKDICVVEVNNQYYATPQ